MKPLKVGEIANLSGGRLLQGDPESLVDAVSTDTRQIAPGALFVALSGERFDGHDFLPAAIEAKASALMVSRRPDDLDDFGDSAVIEVEDTLTGLQELARGYRRQLRARAVVITGSNGKTSTKDMIREVLGSRYRVAATKGNFNNHIGLPLSILNTGPEDDYAVWEIGMNHPGEIAPLAEIAAPDLAVITNIGTAHIGNMGSREAIAEEKGRLAEALTSNGVLILNANDDFTASIRRRTAARVVTAGMDAGEVRASGLEIHEDGTTFELENGNDTVRVKLPIPGRHMVSNALLAAAVGFECGLTAEQIGRALTNVRLTPGRLQILQHEGVRIINDAYNANPDSMRASLATVGAMNGAGKKFAILGEMGELGGESEQAHREIGQLALAEGFHHICSVSDGARGFTESLEANPSQAIHHFQNHQEAAVFLRDHALPGDVVLLKGSRSAAMDTIYNIFATGSA